MKETFINRNVGGGGSLNRSIKGFTAFTLAEMMVVMLIMSIILAAMAPVMTTRSKADSSSPWRYSPENLSDAYFGAGESQIAMIGQPNKLETDDAARLILNTSASLPIHLSFKRDNTTVGRLQLVGTNLVLGSGSMDHLTDGSNNISIGPNNLTQVTSGGSNIAIGDSALTSTTSGTSNIGIGTTLTANIDGNNNVAVGDDALTKANSTWNVAIGKNAYELGTGGSNTIVGGDAMSEGSGTNNVAVGTNSLWYGNGDGNVAIGANSNYKNASLTNFTNTTAIGFSSYASGEGAVAIGAEALTSSSDAIAIGHGSQADGESSIAIGSVAETADTIASGVRSIAIGDGAVASSSDTIAIGTYAKASKGSLAIGNIALINVTSGEYNTALGHATLRDNTEGSRNIAIGNAAMSSNISGSWNTAAGNSALYSNNQGDSNTAVGNASLTSNTSGDNNSAFGDGSLYYNTYGSNNVAVGYNSLRNAIGGSNNTSVGSNACSNVTGSNKTCIGANAGPDSGSSWSQDSVERIFIGSKSKFNDGPAVLEVHNGTANHYISKGPRYLSETAVVVNGSLIVKGPIVASIPKLGSNAHEPTGSQIAALFGSDDGSGNIRDAHNSFRTNSNSVENYFNSYGAFKGVNGNVDNLSDRRLKYVGKEFTAGLNKIKELKIFNYTFKKDETKTPHVGVIAQDLQKVFPDAVKKGTDGFLTIRFEDMFFAMINAIKELDTRMSALEKENRELKIRIEKLETKIK